MNEGVPPWKSASANCGYCRGYIDTDGWHHLYDCPTLRLIERGEEMSELKPCPFCGSTYTELECLDADPKWKYIHCVSCGADANADLGESGAVDKWNTRPIEDALQRKLDELQQQTIVYHQTKLNELQRKLDIAMEALKLYADDMSWDDTDFPWQQFTLNESGAYNAQVALAEIANITLQKPPVIVKYPPLDGDPELYQPFTLGTKPNGHVGVDWKVKPGTKVYACSAGKVYLAVQDSKVYGRFVAILHPDGYASWYAHLSKLLVKKGDNVKGGELIALSGGAVGSDGAGQSTGWHLHFEIRSPGHLDNNKRNVDPLVYLNSLLEAK